MSLFIVGLPSTLRQRLIVAAQRHNTYPGFALAAPDKAGVLRFVPHEAQACADLEAYCDTNDDWTQLQILVLPYAPIGADLTDTIDIIESGGATVVNATPGAGSWPALSPQGRYGGDFNQDAFAALVAHLNWHAPPRPSERFERSSRRLSEYLILANALDSCDAVESVRVPFLYKSGDALEEFCRKRGAIGKSLGQFFEEKGLDLAQSGGIETTLRLTRAGRRLGDPHRSNVHLKEGDHTTAQGAARIYFQHVERDGHFRLALFFVGPHPDIDIDRTIEWDGA